jgi:hypothetical protein
MVHKKVCPYASQDAITSVRAFAIESAAIYMTLYICINIYTYECTCIYKYMYIYIYIYIYVFVYLYTHDHGNDDCYLNKTKNR